MNQNIKLNYFQLSKFDQPDVMESKCLQCVEENLETSTNVKLISYKSYAFDMPQSSKIEEIIRPSGFMGSGIPLCRCVTLQDIDGSVYKRPYNCIFVFFVFIIIFSIYFYCIYRSYF